MTWYRDTKSVWVRVWVGLGGCRSHYLRTLSDATICFGRKLLPFCADFSDHHEKNSFHRHLPVNLHFCWRNPYWYWYSCCLLLSQSPKNRNKPRNPMHPPDFAGYPTELPVKLRNPKREVFQQIPMGDPMSGDVATDHRGLIAGTKGMFTCEVHVGKPTKSGISWGYHDANRHESIEAKGKIYENMGT